MCALLLLVGACHGKLFGGRTTDEDKELNNFAEARQRAATFYDGGDYDRAAAQYQQALSYRPQHVPSHLGYAYSLLATSRPSNLVKAKTQFEKLGRKKDLTVEVKRVYGLALTCRGLASSFERRSRINARRDRGSEARADLARSRDFATSSIEYFDGVLEIDEKLTQKTPLGPLRVSASLAPDAHLGIAHCEILMIRSTDGMKRGADARKTEKDNLARLARAEDRLQKFSAIAQNARRFWELRREKVLRTDPLQDDDLTGAKVIDPNEKERYEARIRNTVRDEVTVRRIMLDTLLYMNQFKRAIAQATKILDLNDDVDEAYLLRGRAYAWLQPPNYSAAVKDLKEYRRRQDLASLTDDLVRLNRRIRDWEKKANEQKKP